MAQTTGAATYGDDTITVKLTNDLSTYLLDSLDGNDTITISGNGSVTILTGAGNDAIINNGSGTASIQLGGGNDIYSSRGNTVDTVWGQAGDDQIELGNGNDWVKGGGGNDILTGGDGVDTFHYPFIYTMQADGSTVVSSVCAHDTIRDFQLGVDRLEFGPQTMTETQFGSIFDVSGYDANADGRSDGSILTLANGDPSFSIKFANVIATEQAIYNSIDWFV